jgi:plastocyanin
MVRTHARGRLVTTFAALALLATVGVVLATRTAVVGASLTSARVTNAATSISILRGSCAGGGSEFCFSPESVTVAVGGTVTWTNQTGVGHTISSCTTSACPGAPANTGSNTFNKPMGAANGSTVSITFSGAGTYTYYCMIHGYAAMHGKIIVGSAPPKPTIAKFTPTSGAPGAKVTITGKNLEDVSQVTFNGTSAAITKDSATKIIVNVPAGATTGKITVVTPAGSVVSSKVFKVT